MAGQIIPLGQLREIRRQEWRLFMGLDFSKPASQPAVQTQPAEEAEVVEQYDIVSDRQQMNTELTGSPEVDALARSKCIIWKPSYHLVQRRQKRYQNVQILC